MHKICEICKKAPATVHLTDIKNNVKKEVHMCEECAAEKGINIHKSVSLEQMFSQGGKEVKNNKQKHAKIICEHCGLNWGEFRENGRLGCEHDYVAFKKGLEPLLEDIHAARLHHTGKSPRQTPQMEQQKRKLDIQRQLREAVAREDYELAARLRDEICQLDLR